MIKNTAAFALRFPFVFDELLFGQSPLTINKDSIPKQEFDFYVKSTASNYVCANNKEGADLKTF
jgi:hypothetical protein